MIRVSDIAMAHGIQGTEEMKRIIVKHLPDMRQAKRLKPSESHLLILKSAVHAEAIEKNKKCLQEGFGEKTDPRLDSFIDYLVSNKVSHTLVETAIMEQIACVDLKDQHEYIQNHKDIQQAARKIMKTVEGCVTLAELANWHKCYLRFRTATGLFIMGIDYLVHSEYEDSLACLVECYLVNKKLEGMTPTALNRYKTMNRRGYYVNLCIQYCNEALINRYEDRENLNVVLKDVLSILIPAIKILMEKAIVFPSGEAGKSLKAIRGKWEEIDEYCKKMWMFTIENALSDNIGSHFALTKLSKDRVDVFQKDTGILALNKFYAGYMDIVRQWNSDLVEMVVVVTNMSRLDFNKKLADQQKRKEFKVLGWEPALKATGIHAMFAPMPTGRGRGILSQALPPIPVRGGGRGRDQNAQVLPDTAVKAPTPPPTPPPVSTIQLVPADSPGYDSGAISDDEEEEIEPPSQVEPDTQLLIQVVQEPGLLAVPRSNSEPSSSRSSSPFNVETIAELKDALARDGDFKFLVSEELTKTKVYQDYMEKYARDQDMGDESATTFHLKQTSEDIEDKGDNMEHVADISDKRMEIGNTSPEVEDRFCPLESLDEKINQAAMKPVETEGVEMDKTEK